MAANPSCLRDAVEFIRTGASEAGLPEQRMDELTLVIEELFVNVCCHAYLDSNQGVVILSYSVPTAGELIVEIADQGVAFNPLTAPPTEAATNLQGPNLQSRPAGGLGILLVKALAPAIGYRREHDWNRLTFRISAAS